MKKALLIGDTQQHPAHDVQSIATALADVYDGVFAIDVRTDYDRLALDELKAYAAVFDMASDWENKGTRKSIGTLLAYVADGGNYLGLNSGLVHGQQADLDLLTASRFLGSPTPILLDLAKTETEHLITERFTEAHFSETPLHFLLDPLGDVRVLVHYHYADGVMPAVWCRTFGWGKVLCVAPGYQTESILPQLSNLLYRGGQWFLNRL